MKIKELKQKSVAELEMLLRESRKKLQELSFDLASRKLKNTNEIKNTKRLVARLMTILKK